MNAPAELITRRAPLAATSWNSESWTFEAVLSAGASVERWDARGAYDEILSLSQTAWPSRVPLLDSHGRESVDRQLGRASTRCAWSAGTSSAGPRSLATIPAPSASPPS